MLLLLPPSETKRDGGEPAPLDYAAFARPRLNPVRRRLVTRLKRLSHDVEASRRALGVSAKQEFEIQRNRALTQAATMPVIDRYTGVLFDGLDAPSLSEQARRFAGEHVSVHSALFGVVSALDRIPAYRLSSNSRIPDVSLRDEWRVPIGRELDAETGLILDMRSESYVKLGSAPRRANSVYLRVVTTDENGRKRALNHFNKKAKGLFTRAILESGQVFETVADLSDWAASAGFVLDSTPVEGEIALVV